MIFVTVGTHEQQFNRLIRHIDNLKKSKDIKDEVFIQTGYSDYVPKFCKWKKILTNGEMIEKIISSDIIITHGGPSSFILPIQYNKTLIVVPRLKEFNEHVNDHQLDFCKKYYSLYKNILLVEDINLINSDLLKKVALKSKSLQKSNTKNFCKNLEVIINSKIK